MINDDFLGFDDDFFDDDDNDLFDLSNMEDVETCNPYLVDSKKGLELISSFLHVSENTKHQMRDMKRLDRLIDERLLQSINRIHLQNEVMLYESLVKLSDKLFEQNKMRLLKNKLSVGIGGQFSAGKSKFINSILGEEILPEDQVPTTSIATYLMKGSDFFVEAYTKNNRTVPLDREAVKALSHEFYNKYKLGFSQFISNLVISTKTFPYESVVLLDTPGYSKSDSSKKQAISDNEKALVQLKAVDYLVWLIDVENGVIKNADIEFIESLNMKNPVLIVFNKADKLPVSKLREVIENTKAYLGQTNIPVYAVIGYSSREKKEYLRTNGLKKFFNEINQMSVRQQDLEGQILSIIKKLERQIEKLSEELIGERNELGNYIFRSQDVAEVKSLTEVYAAVLQEMKDVQKCKRNLQRTKEQIQKQFALLKSRGAL
ncbi:MAG: dynamin family protein [Neobacillus sp.]